MAASVPDQIWRKFLDQHESVVALLDTHASLLAELRELCDKSSSASAHVSSRLATTESLVASFKQSTESLSESLGRKRKKATPKPPSNAVSKPESEQPLPHRDAHINRTKPTSRTEVPAAATEPIVDPSGLFTVDTNPTPLDQLYQEQPGAKRKHQNLETRSSQREAGHHGEPQPKRSRPSTGEEEDAPTGEAEEDSFVKRVAARTRAKEEQKKAKLDKKRKRTSDSSAAGKSPKNKKQKGRSGTKRTASVARKPLQSPGGKRANGESTEGQPHKKRKKSKR